MAQAQNAPETLDHLARIRRDLMHLTNNVDIGGKFGDALLEAAVALQDAKEIATGKTSIRSPAT